jgi:hypothetical protein
MKNDPNIAEIPGLYKVVALQPFRKTAGVSFDILPKSLVPKIDAVDRVIHKNRAVSPGPVGDVLEPWYMHPHQADHLIVLQGMRHVEIYTKAHGRIESFIVSPERIEHNDKLLYDGPALLVWPRGVFHRIKSGETGSASINLNIYELDIDSGKFRVIREGHLDQSM